MHGVKTDFFALITMMLSDWLINIAVSTGGAAIVCIVLAAVFGKLPYLATAIAMSILFIASTAGWITIECNRDVSLVYNDDFTDDFA